MGGEHVHGEKPEPSGDEYRSRESENERGARGGVRMRASRRPKGERVSGGFVVRGLANRSNRRSGGTHVKRRKSFNVGEEKLTEVGLAESSKERTRGDYSAEHGMFRTVHVL